MNTYRILFEVGSAIIVAGAITYWSRWLPARALTVLTICGLALYGLALLLWLFRV
jgi:ABC-type tungstate transport system substrate-binding protein